MLLRARGRAQAGPVGIVSLTQVPRLQMRLENLGVEGPAGGVSRFETLPRQGPERLLFSGFRLLHPRYRSLILGLDVKLSFDVPAGFTVLSALGA